MNKLIYNTFFVYENNFFFTFFDMQHLFYCHLVFLDSCIKILLQFRVIVTKVVRLYCCLSNQHILCQLHTQTKVDRRILSSNGYNLIIWNQITWISLSLEYFWYWWRSETLFRSPVSRVHSENSSHKLYLYDKHKSQPHRPGVNMITKSQLTAPHSFWKNLSFTLCCTLYKIPYKPQILVFKKNFIVISIIFYRLSYRFL